MSTTIVWFRHDLRITDHHALLAAAKRGPVVPLFIWAPHEEGRWPPGAASKWWLHRSLVSLAEQLKSLGSRLILRAGNSIDVLTEIIRQTKATAVYWSRRYEPAIVLRDTEIKAKLRKMDVEAESFNGSLLVEPWEIATKAGKPFQVFTPFWKALQTRPEPAPAGKTAKSLEAPQRWPKSDKLSSFELQPKIAWDTGLRAAWQAGSQRAHERLNEFLEGGLATYDSDRNRPDLTGSSRLSPHLHFGEISPREVWQAVTSRMRRQKRVKPTKDEETFLRELGWREFAYHLLYHFPNTTEEPLRADFARFPWCENAAGYRAWCRGRTGYPLVDAGMRELWTTGWMHNRVRMVTASFLVKHLRIPWQEGARWFWDTLVDADLANNTLGWQWTAGCGADAAPYFRIFNPMSQGEKFDPNGDYVRRWVPELKHLSDRWLQNPWEAPNDVELGTYPKPIVDHQEARREALAAFAKLRK